MINVSKKVLWLISGTGSAIIAATTTLCGMSLNNVNFLNNNNNSNSNYRYYSISNKISNNQKINSLIDHQSEGQSVTYFINEKRFLNNFKTIVQESLQAVPTFAKDYLNYVIDCHYKIVDQASILVKIDWYLPKSNIKYYDQFKICLNLA